MLFGVCRCFFIINIILEIRIVKWEKSKEWEKTMERDLIDNLYSAAGDCRVIVRTLSEARATIELAT